MKRLELSLTADELKELSKMARGARHELEKEAQMARGTAKLLCDGKGGVINAAKANRLLNAIENRVSVLDALIRKLGLPHYDPHEGG